MSKIKYDAIGYWSEVKLDIVREYAGAYSRIMAKQRSIQKHIYVDAFAGAGQHVSKTTGEFILGSPLNALYVKPPFTEYHLIDLDGDKAGELRRVIGTRPDVFVYEEEANETLLNKVLPRCRYQDFHRSLCLLDPYAINVDWKVIETAGKMKSVEIFYNFMIMDANMNVLRRNPDSVSSAQLPVWIRLGATIRGVKLRTPKYADSSAILSRKLQMKPWLKLSVTAYVK